MYTVYILRTSKNTLYIGQTNNLTKRLLEHKSKSSRSAKYTRAFDKVELVYSEDYSTRKEAMQREFQLKKWTKVKKEALVNGDQLLLKKLESHPSLSLRAKNLNEVKEKEELVNS